MARRAQALLFPVKPPPLALGVVVAAAAVTVTTLLLYPLEDVAPAVSLGVVYLLAVLGISATWGLGLGLVTAVASAAAFNFFHIPPVGHFTIRDPQNWVALVVFVIAALLAGSVAQLARARAAEAERRRREADLAAEMARLLLRGADLPEALSEAAHRLAQTLGLPSAAIELTVETGDDRRTAFPLREGARHVGTLLVPATADDETQRRLQERVVPALEALLAAALDRSRLQNEVVETAALRRSDVVKTALLRTVSHDLRTPVTAIVASGEALRSSTLDDAERAELTDVVVVEAKRLARVVDKLLDLSRLQAGAADPHREWFSVDEVVEAAIENLGLPADAFVLSLDADLPPLRADAAQLERAFGNVLENAAAHSGGHPVSVRARAVGGRIVVRVVDRGPGIPAAQRERIFEPFYRARDERGDGRQTGAGLGLAIARGFVTGNGGRIWAESLPNQGTSIVMEFPLDEAAAPAAVAE
jgi:two-component system, OmpR family, sensor histidine kinase KdpD